MNNLTTSTCKRYTRNPEMNLREAKCYHRFINTKLKNLVFYKKLNRGGQNQDRRLEY